MVALADAWQKGAQEWEPVIRRTFANDPLNLLAVDGRANQAKGAGDAATWLPKNKAFRCTYVARQVAVKRKYGLWVTVAERNAIVRILTACPDIQLPRGGARLPQVETPSTGPDAPTAPATCASRCCTSGSEFS